MQGETTWEISPCLVNSVLVIYHIYSCKLRHVISFFFQPKRAFFAGSAWTAWSSLSAWVDSNSNKGYVVINHKTSRHRRRGFRWLHRQRHHDARKSALDSFKRWRQGSGLCFIIICGDQCKKLSLYLPNDEGVNLSYPWCIPERKSLVYFIHFHLSYLSIKLYLKINWFLHPMDFWLPYHVSILFIEVFDLMFG